MKSMSAYISKKNVEVQGRTYKIQDSQRILNTFNVYRGAAQCSAQSYNPIFYNRFRKCPKINCPKPFVLGSILNGGSPNSTFPFILNGGSPSSSFPFLLNGGKPPLPTILNGGLPNSIAPSGYNGGSPNSSFPSILNGGKPTSI